MKKGDMLWLPLYGVRYAFGSGGPEVGAVVLIVFHTGAKKPGINCMWSPCWTDMNFFMDKEMRAGWSDCCGDCTNVGQKPLRVQRFKG
jgi:hypothetical protein